VCASAHSQEGGVAALWVLEFLLDFEVKFENLSDLL